MPGPYIHISAAATTGSELSSTDFSPLQIQFHASAPKLKHNEGTVLRIQQRQNGAVVGGYTVLLYRR